VQVPWCAGIALLLLFGAGVARGAAADVIALDLSACASPPATEVRALLALELRERLLPEAAAEPAAAEHVLVVCDEARAQLTLREQGRVRTLALSSVQPELRARLLALAIAELLQQPGEARAASAARPSEAAEPATEAPPPPSAAAAPRPAPPALPRFALWAGLEVSATPVFALGGSLSFRARLWRLLAWSSAFAFTQGTRAIDRGELRVQSNALRTGPALLLEDPRGALQLGLGARVGALRLRGVPDDRAQTESAEFRSWYVGPALFAGGLLRLGRRAILALELELAYTMRRVRADVEGGGALTLGPWRASAVLGAGAAW
jgi:hypothetical protein